MLADIDERQLLYVASSHHDPTQLMWADGEGGAKRALTQLNATPLAEIASARVQNFHITGAADDQVGMLAHVAAGRLRRSALPDCALYPWWPLGRFRQYLFH